MDQVRPCWTNGLLTVTDQKALYLRIPQVHSAGDGHWWELLCSHPFYLPRSWGTGLRSREERQEEEGTCRKILVRMGRGLATRAESQPEHSWACMPVP